MRKLLIAAVLLMVPVLAWGQAQTTGRISGRVTDESGAAIEGALVTVQSPALQGVRTFATDQNGRYIAALLPPGQYSVSITAPGAEPLGFEVTVGIGQNIPLDVTVKAGGISETVTVFGNTSKLTTTAGGEDFSYDQQVNELPIINRSPERVAELSPNVSFGPTPNTISISGAPSFDTVVLLDGAEVSDPYFGSAPDLFIEDALEEVQVLTSGVSARYGRFQGGVVNATTKSGGNTLDAGVRIDLQNQSWNDQTPLEERQVDDTRETYQATVSGPILKDRLWFLAAGRTIPTNEAANQTAISQQSFVTTTDQDRLQGKLTGAITPDHVIEVNYSEYEQETSGYAGLPAADLRAASGVRSDPRETWTAEYQGILSDKLFLNIQGTTKDVSIAAGAGDPALGSPFLDFYGAFQIWHNHWWDVNDPSVRDNETLSASLTQVLSTANWGDHTLEYGAQYVNSTTGGENRQTSTGFNLLNYDAVVSGQEFSDVNTGGDPNDPRFNLLSYASGGVTYRWEALPLGGDQELENIALYVQDTWQQGRWRIDAGVRWESYDGSGPQPTLDMDFDELAPRLGATYSLDNNWQLQATWGKYISRFNDNVAGSITGVSGAPYIVTLYTGPDVTNQTYDQIEALIQDDANWGIVTTVTDPTQPTRYLAEDAKAPYAYDLTISAKRALPRNTGTFTINYSERRYRGLLDDFIGDQGVSTVTDPSADPPGSGADFDLDTTIWDNADQAERDYDALSVTWDYRPGSRWNVGGNWTYAHTLGNYEGEGRNTPSSGSIIGNYVRSIPQEAAVPYGYTDDDIRQRVRAWGNYGFDFGRAGTLNLGAVGTYQSGLPYNTVGSRPIAADPLYLNEVGRTYTHFIGGRGNNRFDGFWRLDMSARYTIGLVKRLNLWTQVNVINVTNNDELVAFNTGGRVEPNANGVLVFVPGGNFGKPRSDLDYQTPRSYFVSVGLNW